jgi:hypothetical protein
MLAKMDEKEVLAQREWMTGKCFALRGTDATGSAKKGFYGYCRIDKFTKFGNPIGLRVFFHKGKPTYLEFNCEHIRMEDINRGKNISHARFDEYLEKVRILTHTPEEDTIREKGNIIKPLHTNFADKVKKIKPTVAYILKRDLDARDDDNLMCALLWELQGAKKNMSFGTFKRKLIMGELATPESATRSRRLLQEKYPDLRGKFYAERHDQEELLKHQLRIDFD